MRKRLLSILLCLVMVTGLFPTVAFAADKTADGPAAQVGEQKFVRLDEAVKAAKAGDTITFAAGDFDVTCVHTDKMLSVSYRNAA